MTNSRLDFLLTCTARIDGKLRIQRVKEQVVVFLQIAYIYAFQHLQLTSSKNLSLCCRRRALREFAILISSSSRFLLHILELGKHGFIALVT